MQPDPGAQARLLGLFLEGVSRPQRFAEGLRLLAELLNVERAGIRVWDRRGSWACVREARRADGHWHLSADDTPALHPEWRWLASTLETGRWQGFRVLHDRSQGSESDRQNIPVSDMSLGLRLTMQNGADGLLLLKSSSGQAPNALPPPSGELIKALQSAMELTAQLRQLNHKLACSYMLLDAIRLPLLLLDPSMRLLAANGHARPLMETLATGTGKRHIGLRGVCGTKFSTAVRSACDLSPRTMGSILRPSSEPVRQILVLPIVMRHSGRAERAALILVHGQLEQTPSQGAVNQLLQQVYGLTPAEVRLAMLILDGQAPGDAASRLKVSVATVRTQLSAILKKTGARKQAELVRQLSPLMVLHRSALTLEDHAM